MKLKILSVGKIREAKILPLIEKYHQRLIHFFPFTMEEVRETPVKKGQSPLVSVEAEAEAILKKIGSSEFIILDEKGWQGTTQQWADRFVRFQNSGQKELIFVIGGAYGLADVLKKKARETWSLSALTYTHEMARLILVEQLYRVGTILKGVPYHNS